MTRKFFEIAFTPDVLEAQQEAYGRTYAASPAEIEPLTATERAFIAERDSFYMATVNQDGWPYLQHRGGGAGFLRVLDERTLAFTDLPGNRQLVSVGNISGDRRVSLFLMDYAGRRRLKILGRAKTRAVDEELLTRLYGDDERPEKVERVVIIEIVAYDWNCPKYITPRFTDVEVQGYLGSYKERIAELEAELATVRGKSASERQRGENR